MEIGGGGQTVPVAQRRSPRGERGLKYKLILSTCSAHQSLPARGAWIEIRRLRPLTRSDTSLPARGAWIEILSTTFFAASHAVAPREGSVD